jgi:hypothetical protein
VEEEEEEDNTLSLTFLEGKGIKKSPPLTSSSLRMEKELCASHKKLHLVLVINLLVMNCCPREPARILVWCHYQDS